MVYLKNRKFSYVGSMEILRATPVEAGIATENNFARLA
jgi:hypothetical protein